MLQKILFFFLIFLIPSNLAYHLPDEALAKAGFDAPSALVDGILVDYLLPKLYLTDILILALLIPWLIRASRKLPKQLKLAKLLTIRRSLRKFVISHLSLVIFFTFTLLRIPSTTSPFSSLWFWLKLVEMTLFICWFRSFVISHLSLVIRALTLSVLWQSLLAISQWLLQRNVFPYFVLGESQFSALTPGIAKASFGGVLKVLPLGTTPHPNVLAGFIAVSLIIIYLISSTRGKYLSWNNISQYIITIFGLFTLLLTQSVTAITIFILASFFISLKLPSITRLTRPLVYFIFILCAGVLVYWFTGSHVLEPTSLSRRAALNHIALKMFSDHPLTGVGLNNFTAVMKNYGDVEATYRFFQPVHNIYLLVLAETGLIGFALVILIFFRFFKLYATRLSLYAVPALMLALIGFADHFPITLQQGQLLLAISLSLLTNLKKP